MESIHLFGAALGLGLTVIGAGLGIGRLAASAAEGIARQPDAAELMACVQVAKVRGLPVVCRALINSNEFAFLP